MKYPRYWRSTLAAAVVWFMPLLASAQTDPTSSEGAAPRSKDQSEVVRLTPFEVQGQTDKGYAALNSNSVTGFNAALDKLPLSADIFDATFMRDVGATSVEDVIQTYSAGAGYSGADPGGAGGNQQPGDRNGNAYITLRGFQTPSMVRDGFMPVGSLGNPGSTGVGVTSNFDTERVEIIEGPQALLYGQGGAGGVINVVSKAARIGKPAFGELLYRVDQYGGKQGQIDYGVSAGPLAARVTILQQDLGNRRINVGGPMEGYYTQLAYQLFNTTVRITGQETAFHRINSNDSAFTAQTTAADARNGEKLNYILATNQVFAAANGGASGSGPIDNGLINWGNVNSYEGQWASELTVNRFVDLVADSRWTNWLSTQLSLGYDDYYDDRVNDSFSFYAPQNANNKLGGWAGQLVPGDTEEPVQTKAFRFTALVTNDWGKWGHSQTVLGIDDIKSVQGQFAYEYFQADSSFNPVYGAANTLNGRTPLAAQQFPIDRGPLLYNIFSPRSKRVTVGGVNYLRMLQNPVDPTKVSAADPLGITPGGANYSINNITNKGIFGANYSNWLDGRLDTLFGFRVAQSLFSDTNQGSAPPSPPKAYRASNETTTSFNVGADYSVTPWLHPYVEVSDSFDPPVSESADPYGNLPKTAHGFSEEVGFKLNNAAKTLSGSFAVYHTKSTNEQLTLSSTIENDINPSGVNGREGSPNQWINVDRESQGAELKLTASPTENWRARFTAAFTNGKINKTVAYAQYYNDQFHENAAGDVTYADGAIVYVNPTFNSKSTVLASPSPTGGLIPLTVAMMNDSTNPYYANPQNVNGQIATSSGAYAILKLTDPTHGSIATGVPGLPISAAQINHTVNPTIPNYVKPPGIITAVQQGDFTSGYPEFATVLTNNYIFSSGWARGISVGGTLRSYWNYRYYYYYANGVTPSGAGRTLFYKPNATMFDGLVGYSRKFRRVVWSTQLNIYNLFNHYDIILLPGENTGFTSTGTDATFTAQPRSYAWTNRIEF